MRLRQDFTIAIRGFRRSPTFVVAVLAILGLAIGMATAIFSAFQAVLVHRLPVQHQAGLAVLWPYRVTTAELAPPASDLIELRRASRTMQSIAGVAHWGVGSTPFRDEDRTVTLAATEVSGNYFEVLGARPLMGRLLRQEDDEPGERAMVLSYRAWQSEFGGAATVVGRRLVQATNNMSYTIVGVAEPGLDYPVGVECWTSIVKRWEPRVLAIARLAPGASIDAARQEYFAIIDRLEPSLKLTGAAAIPFETAMVGDARPILAALAVAVGLLLLIACVNVGNLFLARAAVRARELAVRRALGASYRDLVRQLVTESALLALAGGILGAVVAAGLLHWFVAEAPRQLPRLDDVRAHRTLLSIAVGVTSLSVFLFGVLPALVSGRTAEATPLRRDARSGSATPRGRRIRHWLVATQVALALVMLAGAGLLARSLLRLQQIDLGFHSKHLTLMSLAFDWQRYDSLHTLSEFGERVERRLRAVPGITGVTPVLAPPFQGPNINIAAFEAEGREPEINGPVIPWEPTSFQYFATFGTPILRGRAFAESDDARGIPVVVVSESVARRFWPATDPIGQRIRFVFDSTPGVPASFFAWRTVVGVAADTRFRVLRQTSPTVYLPWQQWGAWPGTFLAIRSAGSLSESIAAVRSALREIDPALTVWDARSMDELLGGPLAEPRLTTLLLTAFGTVALLLAAIGLYGVMSSVVRERTREIGIRMALGATSRTIRVSVLREALVVVGAGAAVGLGFALAATRLLRSLLFGISPSDPATLGAVSLGLVVVAAAAAYLPANRATRVDPVRALRAE